MILVELLLSAATSPQFAGHCRQWLRARRDAFRRMAEAAGADPIAFDIMGLHLLSESSFAVSCGGSATYALLARAGFLEAAALLTGRRVQGGDEASLAALARHFFADPTVDRKGAVAKERGVERRGRIVDAAASIIEEEGLAAVTNRSVADRAGVSLALTTYHFKSVSDLAFSGILRVFEKVNAGLLDRSRRDNIVGEPAVDRIRSRSQPSGVERLRSRGMAEISLAAARGLADEGLGLAMRQQRGTITHASLGVSMQGAVTRTRAASHALWSSAAFLVAAAIDDADSLFDFESQARFAAGRLLQNS
jgi:AcrR family transcriptional regulator